jgi:NTE family protein
MFPFFVHAQAPAPAAVKNKGKRPKVGLVLSGGGAKGFAYIGLFKVLKEVGLHIDYVAGTSIGSIMAGFYAAGYDPDTLTAIVRAQDWDKVMSDDVDRKYVPFIDKEMGNKLVIALPIDKEKRAVSLMSSLSEGQNVDLLLNRFFASNYKTRDFSKLPVPFFCIATDLFTGNAVLLDTGSMVHAIRASMSIPGYFNPVKYGDKYLVDGGVVNNFPVMDMKNKGVSFVIGGDVQMGLAHDIKQLSTVTDVIMQITGYHAERANKINLANTDLYIHFDMGSYNMMSFNDYDSIIAIGERTARAHYDELKALADSLNELKYVPVNEFNGKPLDSVFVSSIEIVGNKKVPAKYFHNLFASVKGEKISVDKLESIVNQMFGSGFFKHVKYELQDVGDDKVNVVIHVKETGVGELAAGIHYDTDYGGALLVNAMFRNVLIRGSKMYLNMQLGNSNRLRSMFVMDRGPKPGFGVATDFYGFDFGDYDGDIQSNELSFTNYKFSAFASNTFLNQYNLRFGVDYEYFAMNQNVYDSLYEPFTGFNSYLTLFGEFNFDTRDRASYATKGTLFKSRVEYILPLSKNWSSEVFDNATILFVNFEGNIAVDKKRKLVFRPGLFAGYTFNKKMPPFNHFFGIGGFNNFQFEDNIVPFAGTKFIQEFGHVTGIGRLRLQYNIYKKLYLIGRTDFGVIAWDFDDLMDDTEIMAGYAITAAYDSFIGPIEITAMGSNVSGLAGFVTLGFWF